MLFFGIPLLDSMKTYRTLEKIYIDPLKLIWNIFSINVSYFYNVHIFACICIVLCLYFHAHVLHPNISRYLEFPLQETVFISDFACLFGLILYVSSTIFQLNRDESSWVEPVLS